MRNCKKNGGEEHKIRMSYMRLAWMQVPVSHGKSDQEDHTNTKKNKIFIMSLFHIFLI